MRVTLRVKAGYKKIWITEAEVANPAATSARWVGRSEQSGWGVYVLVRCISGLWLNHNNLTVSLVINRCLCRYWIGRASDGDQCMPVVGRTNFFKPQQADGLLGAPEESLILNLIASHS